MRIKGGTVFVSSDDEHRNLHIERAIVVMDVPSGSSLDSFTSYLRNRLYGGSSVVGCTFLSLEDWSNRHAEEVLKCVAHASKNERGSGLRTLIEKAAHYLRAR